MFIVDGATVLRGSRALQGEAVVSDRTHSGAHTSSGRSLGIRVNCATPPQRGPQPARVVAASTSSGASWGGAGLRTPGNILSRFLEKGVSGWREDAAVRGPGRALAFEQLRRASRRQLCKAAASIAE